MTDYDHREWLIDCVDTNMDTLKQDIHDHLGEHSKGQVNLVTFLVDNTGKVTVKGFRLRHEGILPDHIFHDVGKMMERARE